MKRRIAVVTTSRADYGHLYWILKTLAAHPKVDLKLIALGAHLSPQFGNTINHAAIDGFPHIPVECLLSSDTDVGMAKTIGVAILGLADLFDRLRPDLILLTADRYEMLAPANVALALRIPIAHIEGGEISEGAIDDAVRNALTKMSHIHFACTQKARKRIIMMGEEPWRVHFTGSPSLDHLRRNRLLTRKALQQKLGISFSQKTILVCQHPVTLLRETTKESDALFAALSELDYQIIFTYPNADAGSYKLIKRTQAFVSERRNAKLFVNLGHLTYLSLLKNVDILIGNSSSGIIESTSAGTPAVNIGIRQKGREHGANVIDVRASKSAILDAISTAMSKKFRQPIKGMENPYGDGHASEKITSVLTSVPLGDKLLFKRSTVS
jgi:UDP-hydrolysing UDP-N-acetyl-D-glucosamine 2-epimerase